MYASFDIETGGFNVTQSAICEIAVIVADRNLVPVLEWQTYIKPYKNYLGEWVSYSREAMEVNKIPLEKLKDGADVASALHEFYSILKQHGVVTMVGHNSIPFDVPRVDHLMRRIVKRSILEFSHHDTKRLAREKYPNAGGYSLENLCGALGIVNKNPHSALGDADATLKLYRKLRGI